MKQTKTMLRLELEVKPEMAANCHLAAMAPMTVMATGRRSILLASRQMSAAAVLDTLTMLKGAQEALLSSLEEACGSCDSLCEEFAYRERGSHSASYSRRTSSEAARTRSLYAPVGAALEERRCRLWKINRT